MPPRRNSVPAYLLHKRTGEARVNVYSKTGKRHTISLGPHGSPESRKRYRQVLAEMEQPSVVPKPTGRFKPKKSPSIAAVCLAFLDHAAVYYRRADGVRTNEYRLFATALAVLEPEHHLPASEFGRAHLAAVRDRMIDRGWSRQHVNAQVRRIRSAWRWAEEQEHIPEGSWGRLRILSGLKRGRSAAPEQAAVLPVTDADVTATLPHLTPTVARMVKFQRLTGCRPAEVCGLDWGEIDRSGETWCARPAQHKTAHHGAVRSISIGPAARAILGEPGQGAVFSPRSASKEAAVARRNPDRPEGYRERRRTLAPQRFRVSYTTAGYGLAIRRACARAGVTPWSPNQLRHSSLTEFRARYGLEVARVIGGHESAVTTEIYAAVNMGPVLRAVEQIG